MKFVSLTLTLFIVSFSTYVTAEETQKTPTHSSQATRVFLEYKIGVMLPADAKIEDSFGIAQKAQDAALKAVEAAGNYKVFAVSPSITLRQPTPLAKTYRRQFAPSSFMPIMQTRCACCGWCKENDTWYCCEWCCWEE